MIPGNANPLLLASAAAGAAAAGPIKSVRFNDDDTAYLSKTFSSSGNQKTYTMSLWVKRGNLGKSYQSFLSNPNSSGINGVYFGFTSDYLNIQEYNSGGGLTWAWQSAALYRDTNAWYHIVAAVDTTQATAANRLKLYVNGVQVTDFYSGYPTYPSQNLDTNFNNNTLHGIGKLGSVASTSYFYDGLIADFYFIDGSALDASSFGAFDDNGVWQAAAYSGTFGTNGFHLFDFANESTVGHDSSGNENDFTAYNITETQQIVYATNVAAASSGEVPSVGGGPFWIDIDPANNDLDYVSNTDNMTKAHDGSTSTFVYWTGNLGGAGGVERARFDLTSFSTITTLRVYGGFPDGYVDFKYRMLDSSKTEISGTEGTFGTVGWHSMTITGSPKYLEISCKHTSSSSTRFRLYAIELNGDILTNGDLAAMDVLRDVPANGDSSDDTGAGGELSGNYCTWNPRVKPYAGAFVFKNGNMEAHNAASTYGVVMGTIPMSTGKWYWEVTVNGTPSTSYDYIGIVASDSGPAYPTLTTSMPNQLWYLAGGTKIDGSTSSSYGDTYGDGDVIGVALDLDSTPTTLTFYKNGVSQGTAFSNLASGKSWVSAVADYSNALTTTSWNANWGQRAFAYSAPSAYPTLTTSMPNQLWYLAGGTKIDGSTSSSYGDTYGDGDVIGVALDLDSTPTTLTFYKNGVSQGTAFSNLASGKSWVSAVADYSNALTTTSWNANWGQRAFAYSAPSGFKALCTTNLPTPTIADGSDHFAVKTWSGTGAENTLTGFEFSPDMIWVKRRNNSSDWHNITDTVRGATNTLYPNDTYVDTVASQNVKAFTSDGVTLGTFGGVNASGGTYVGWTWDAGANSNKTYTVKVVSDSGNKYRFDDHGTSAVTLDLAEGSTYVFDQSDSSNSGHPLRFSTTSDGTHGSGTEYTTGVTTTGTPGSAGAKTTIVVASGAPTLYYYCSVHSGMGGQVNTNSTAGSTRLSGSENAANYNQDDVWSDNAYADPSSATAGLTNLTGGFNGYLTNNNLSSFTGKVIFPEIQFSSGVTEVIVYVYYSSNANWYVELNNGGTQYVLYQQTILQGIGTIPGGGAYIAEVKLNLNESSITQFAYHGVGNHWFAGIRVNGKLLTNSDITIPLDKPSISSVVKAYPEAGFSISTYTGNGSTAQTIAHGLNSKPSLIIIKNRDTAKNWIVIPAFINDKHFFYLNTDSELLTSLTSYYGAHNSSLIGITGTSSGSNSNTSGDDYLCFAFAPVAGFSSFGTYEGNGNADGTVVLIGFRPAFLMIKRTDGTDNWQIVDSARDPYNKVDNQLYADNVNAEYSSNPRSIDFLSNGFKCLGNNDGINKSGGDYLYIAFAENPFQANGGLAR